MTADIVCNLIDNHRLHDNIVYCTLINLLVILSLSLENFLSCPNARIVSTPLTDSSKCENNGLLQVLTNLLSSRVDGM